VRIYFCSDIHASRKCWKKFLKTADVYGADHIIVGGDITGKFVVPIVEGIGSRRTATFMGVARTAETKDELDRLKTWIADAGQYWFEAPQDEVDAYGGDQQRIDELFHRLALERVREWIDEAEAKLSGSGVRVFVSGANDDFLEVDDLLAASTLIEDPNGTVIDLGDDLQIMGMGWGNVTPWACPRDISEEELGARIDAVAATVRDPGRTIFSLHVPPLGSGLDLAPRLDDELRPQLTATGVEMINVGSSATRDAILRYRPLVGLHGHIHESKGVKQLGGVTIANPGSQYAEGILDGLLVQIDDGRLADVTLVSG
jgi:Icc-related predicted phosphoesterase